MRNLLSIAAISFAVASCASPTQQAPEVSAAHPAAEVYRTDATPTNVLLEDPEARVILEEHLPVIAQSNNLELFGEGTLKSIQGYSRGAISDEALSLIDAQLAALGPRWIPEASSGFVMTTDESRVRDYTLPEALVLNDGRAVDDAQTWWNERRPEILEMFNTYAYGNAPGGAVKGMAGFRFGR